MPEEPASISAAPLQTQALLPEAALCLRPFDLQQPAKRARQHISRYFAERPRSLVSRCFIPLKVHSFIIRREAIVVVDVEVIAGHASAQRVLALEVPLALRQPSSQK